MASDLWQRFASGERLEVKPGEDWPPYLEDADEVKYRILDGWMAFGALVRAVAKMLGGTALTETFGPKDNLRYYIEFKGAWRDPI